MNKSLFELPEIFKQPFKACPSGNGVRKVYHLSIDDNGNEVLDYDEENLQEIIQSYADQCSIERIIISHGLGDELIMNQKPGIYLDEDDVQTFDTASNLTNLNTKLIELYKKTDTDLSFEDFSRYVITGEFEKIKKPAEVSKEDNA